MAAGLGVHRPEAEGIGRHRRVRAFRHDSLHREDEDDAAQLRKVLDLLLGVPTDGDTAATRGIGGARERERKGAGSREQVRERGRGRAAGARGPPCPRGSRQRVGAAAWRGEELAAWRQCALSPR